MDKEDVWYQACRYCLDVIGGDQTCEWGMPGKCDICEKRSNVGDYKSYVARLRLSYIQRMFRKLKEQANG